MQMSRDICCHRMEGTNQLTDGMWSIQGNCRGSERPRKEQSGSLCAQELALRAKFGWNESQFSGFDWLQVILPNFHGPYFLFRMGTPPFEPISSDIRVQTPSPDSSLSGIFRTHCLLRQLCLDLSLVELPAPLRTPSPTRLVPISYLRQKQIFKGCLMHSVKVLWEPSLGKCATID